MKKLLLILLLITSMSYGQITRDSLKVKVYPTYSDIFDELVQQSINYKVDISRLKLLDTIEPKHLNNLWATITPDFKYIYLSPYIPDYIPTFRKFILLHEMSHIIVGPGHLPEGIGPMVMRSGYDIKVEDIILNYCYYEEDYFKFLKLYQEYKK